MRVFVCVQRANRHTDVRRGGRNGSQPVGGQLDAHAKQAHCVGHRHGVEQGHLRGKRRIVLAVQRHHEENGQAGNAHVGEEVGRIFF